VHKFDASPSTTVNLVAAPGRHECDAIDGDLRDHPGIAERRFQADVVKGTSTQARCRTKQHEPARVSNPVIQVNAPANPGHLPFGYGPAQQGLYRSIRLLRQQSAQVIQREQIVFRVDQIGQSARQMLDGLDGLLCEIKVISAQLFSYSEANCSLMDIFGRLVNAVLQKISACSDRGV